MIWAAATTHPLGFPEAVFRSSSGIINAHVTTRAVRPLTVDHHRRG